ncbi:HERC1 [Symbiodinium sp. KB8]|nr:HERC1 [Symbiodinium sp. KB8]
MATGDTVAAAASGAGASRAVDESLSTVVHRLKGMYFTSTKMTVLESLLEASGGGKKQANRGGFGSFNSGWEGARSIRIAVNRMRASKAKEEPETDPEGLRSVFGQVFSALRYSDYARFRGAGKGDQAWTVDLLGEGSIDVGGAYREIVTMLCEDLMSGLVPLFIRCPNGVNEVGLNREKAILNPSATSPLHMAMYEFLGVLFGISLRTRYSLPLDLPSMVWKQVSGDALTPSDLDGVDKLCRQALGSMANMSETDFAELEDTFTTKLSDGSEVELKPGGRSIPVTYETRTEFIARVISARLSESRAQAAAIRRGFNQVVPLGMLSLFAWHEIELLVCGSPRIDIDLLRKHSTYRSGLSPNHPVIQNFWMALHSFSQAERRLFLRFVWGRNRLPTREEDWTSPFSITALSSSRTDSDDMLPVSHTCFFQLDLPLYSNFETMRSKLLYAITNCTAIDTDFSANASAVSIWMD